MKNKLIFLLILNITILNSLYATVGQVTTGNERTVNLFTGAIMPLDSNTQDFSVTLTDQEVTLAEAKSSFNCETGEIKIDASVVNDLNNMLSTFGQDAEQAAKGLISEMATQAGIELSLEVLARLHYTIVQGMASSSDMLKAIKLKDVTKCVTSGFFNALDSELEGGIGTNIYDLFTGKIGINFVSIAGIYPCIKEVLGEPKDESAKIQLEKSRQWVRFFFYKLLNSSFDMLYNLELSAGEISAECEEVKSKIEEGNIGVILAQIGEIVSPTGSKISSTLIVEKPVKVGPRVIPEKEEQTKINKEEEKQAQGQTTEEEAAVNQAKTQQEAVNNDSSLSDEEKTKANKALELKKASARKYIEEVRIKTTIVTKENNQEIDMTDFNPDEIIAYNKNIKNKIERLMQKETSNYNLSIITSFSSILERILTMTTTDYDKLKERDEIFKIKDETSSVTPKPFLYTENTSIDEILQTSYYGELRKKIEYYVNLVYGNLTKREKNDINLRIMSNSPISDSNDYKEIIKMAYYEKIKKKLEKAKLIEKYLASGEPIIQDANGNEAVEFDGNKLDLMVYNEYLKDLRNARPGTNVTLDTSVTNTINQNILLRKPLHELEYLRLLYEAESRDVLLQLLKTNPGDTIGELVMSNKVQDIGVVNKEFIDFSIEKIKYIKEMYAVGLLSAYADRSEGIIYWVEKQFMQPNVQLTEQLMSFYEVEIEKFKYKLLQKRYLIRLLLEKDVK